MDEKTTTYIVGYEEKITVLVIRNGSLELYNVVVGTRSAHSARDMKTVAQASITRVERLMEDIREFGY